MDVLWNCTFIVLSDLTDNSASRVMAGEERAVVVVVVVGGGGGMYACIICLFISLLVN